MQKNDDDDDAEAYPPSLTFTLLAPPCAAKFGPRVGRVALARGSAATISVPMDTPNVLVGTSRGVVAHLSRDHARASDAIRWLNVPFESFLEQLPPIPTLQGGPLPLHRFLGFDARRHIASMCLRNPLDTREMPPNGNTFVSANCVRGVRKVTPSDWRNYVYKMQPDVVFALTDTPFTSPPYSQKRIAKSVERGAAWVADILRRPLPGRAAASEPHMSRHPLNVFVHMAGGTSLPARAAFADGLREELHGPEADAVKPLGCLDEGIAGYAFDLAALRGIKPSPNTSQHQSLPDGYLRLEKTEERSPVVAPANVASLLKASLGALPEQKPRLVTGTRSPHEMLHLMRDVGVDLFDVGWAMNAADLGVALDFVFPAPASDGTGARRSLGHNLYDPVYAHQFGRLAEAFVGAGEGAGVDSGRRAKLVCMCIACSPRMPTSRIVHSAVDSLSYEAGGEATVWYGKPYSRAYVHHLLRTHEMSAHAFLVAHNLALVSTFLAGVREVLVDDGEESATARFAFEVEMFGRAYDEGRELFDAAKKDYEDVERARGRGRLARERDKPENSEDRVRLQRCRDHARK